MCPNSRIWSPSPYGNWVPSASTVGSDISRYETGSRNDRSSPGHRARSATVEQSPPADDTISMLMGAGSTNAGARPRRRARGQLPC